uniref:Uncharacterized protein n=1 Tax=Anguilla anguilla TaxID=7936 RepID=A0A0E9X6S4_ANGAN
MMSELSAIVGSLLLPATELQQDFAVVAGGVALDERVERLAVHLEELGFDVEHVNLSPSHHDSDQHAVCGPQALHGLIQPLSKESRLTSNALHYGQEGILQAARHLPLNALFNVPPRQLLIFLEHSQQVFPVPHAQHGEELDLVGPPAGLASLVQILGILHSHGLIHFPAFIPPCREQRHQNPLEHSGSVAADVVLQVPLMVFVITSSEGFDLCIGSGGQDVDEASLLSPSSLDCIPQLVGIILGGQHQQSQHHRLKITRQLRLQIISQVLPHRLLIGLLDQLSLGNGAVRQDLDYGRLVRARSFHGPPQFFDVLLCFKSSSFFHNSTGSHRCHGAKQCVFSCRRKLS